MLILYLFARDNYALSPGCGPAISRSAAGVRLFFPQNSNHRRLFKITERGRGGKTGSSVYPPFARPKAHDNLPRTLPFLSRWRKQKRLFLLSLSPACGGGSSGILLSLSGKEGRKKGRKETAATGISFLSFSLSCPGMQLADLDFQRERK